MVLRATRPEAAIPPKQCVTVLTQSPWNSGLVERMTRALPPKTQVSYLGSDNFDYQTWKVKGRLHLVVLLKKLGVLRLVLKRTKEEK